MQFAATPHAYSSTAATILDPLFVQTTQIEPPRQLEPEVKHAAQLELQFLMCSGLATYFAWLVPNLLVVVGHFALMGNPQRAAIVDALVEQFPLAGNVLGFIVGIVCLARWVRGQRRWWLALPLGLVFAIGVMFGLKALSPLGEITRFAAPLASLLYAALRSRLTRGYCLSMIGERDHSAFMLDGHAFGFLGWFIAPYARLLRWMLPLVVRPARA